MTPNDETVRPLPLYVPITGRTRLLGALLLLAAALHWTAAGYEVGELRALTGIGYGATPDPHEHLARAKAGTWLRVLQASSALLIAVPFLPWLYRVRCNLRSFGVRRLRFGRQWTYLGFVVPGLNLYRPLQVMSEVWRASHAPGRDPLAWEHVPEAPIVRVWWFGMLGWVAIELFSLLLIEMATGLERIQLARTLALAADTCAAVSASLGFVMIHRIRAAQDVRAALFAPQEATRGLELGSAGGRVPCNTTAATVARVTSTASPLG